ncbi:MAG: hypothetical protein LBP69_05830, partial [Treponema sp.]|nr:hypothetical protein [Treponema sp.]
MRKIPSIVALFCILVYTASVIFAAYRIYRCIERQKETAGAELDGIAGFISQNNAVFFGEGGGNLLQERIKNSEALEGIIITGSTGTEFAFEREPGGIVRGGSTPGFAKRLGISYLPAKQVDVQGLRNVNIYSAYNTVNYALFVEILKQSLAVILAALLVAFLTLIISSTLRKESVESPEDAGSPGETANSKKAAGPEKTRSQGSREAPEEAQNPAQADYSEEYDEEDSEDDFDFTDFSGPKDGETFEDEAAGNSG